MPPSDAIRLLLLVACLVPLKAYAEADAGKGCASAPTSPLVVNVKDKGAKGDGKTDDTDAIQDAIDKVAGTGGTVLVPQGTYMVNTLKPNRLKLGSNLTLKLADGATLKAIPNDAQKYSVLEIAGVDTVTVTGGTLQGERDAHGGKGGEAGMGIRIGKGAKHIVVSGVTARDMWGDGFYVEDAEDVKFCAVVADRNRRQGLSIIDADGILVANSVFKNTRGTRPSAGIDLEPDGRDQKITDLRITGTQFTDNAGVGLLVAGKRGTIARIEVQRNVFKGNRPIQLKGNRAGLASAICNNRYVTTETASANQAGGIYAYADPVTVQHHDDGGLITLNGTGACGKANDAKESADVENPLAR